MIPSLFKNPFKRRRTTLAIVQFTRGNGKFGVGKEEELHWALVAFTSGTSAGKCSTGKLWQAINDIKNDGSGDKVRWTLDVIDVNIGGKAGCLGGVCVGEIRRGDVRVLDEMIKSRSEGSEMILCPTCEKWNCRYWAMETIRDVLIPNGWAKPGIDTQDTLFPSLKKASVQSVDAMRGGAVPVIVKLELGSE